MTKYISAILATIGSIAFVSCSSTPASRIADHAELYYKLAPEQRELVKEGRIAKGMPPSAVFLAWGQPNSVVDGNVNGTPTLRWVYTSLRPVITPRWGGGYWGPWGGPRGYWGPAYYGGYYDDVTYIPVDSGYVLFINDVVDSWEKRVP